MKNELTSVFWEVGMLPFVWKPLPRPTNGNGMPDALPFRLVMDEETGRLMQASNAAVSAALSVAYSQGSMLTGMMDKAGIGQQYAHDFLAFLKRALKRETFHGMRVLEIGCGTGYFLYTLQQHGAECLGVEPGNHGQEGARRFGVKIIQDFFPSPMIRGTFDLIILYAVLEHVENPCDFLLSVRAHTTSNSIIALSVPDCEPYIDTGDISMLCHEHWSYFSTQTLRDSLLSVNASDIHIEKSGFGGSLYAIALLTPAIGARRLDTVCLETDRFLAFKKRAEGSTNKLTSLVSQIQRDARSLAIYVPARAINSLVLSRVDLSHCGFFDDNPLLHGTYFPGIDIPIEPRRVLHESPTDVVLIMSRSFGEKIAEELGSVLPSSSLITIWDDLFL